MQNNKYKLLTIVRELRTTLKSIEELLDEYGGIDGNKSYVQYCLKKAKQANEDDTVLQQLLDDIYNVDISKRVGINIALLCKIIEKYFKLLDDIDTAGDIFKPKWCKITRAVEQLHRLRWLGCTVEENISVNRCSY